MSWANTANGSADDGLAITPNGGDTGKTLFIPNAGWRNDTSGIADAYGAGGYSLSAEESQSNTIGAWRLFFSSSYSSGRISYVTKLSPYSIRCVRS